MIDSHEKLEVLLRSLLLGATIKSFEWSSYYTISFLLSRAAELPPELDITICSNWVFEGIHAQGIASFAVPDSLLPLDEMDCFRGFVLAGITTKVVETVILKGEDLVVGFSGEVAMIIPLKNMGDPDEDSLLVKTPEWVRQSCRQDIQVDGNGVVIVREA